LQPFTLKYSEVEIKKMLEFLIDNIYEVVGGQVFQQSVGVSMGTNSLADLLWPSIRHFDISTTFYLLSTCVDLIYPNKLEIKDTTECSTSASYLDALLKLDTKGKIMTQVHDKREDFNFSIVNFPYLFSNIPASPAYGVYISQLIRYARACDQFLV
jgi:hypothetical protein